MNGIFEMAVGAFDRAVLMRDGLGLSEQPSEDQCRANYEEGHTVLRVIMAFAASAHGMNQIVLPEERCPLHTGELQALIGVDQYLLSFGSASPSR